MIALSQLGCGSKSGPAGPQDQSDQSDSRLTVSGGSGQVDYYSEGPVRNLVYTIKWKEGQATTLDQRHFFFKLNGVSGLLYKDGKVSSAFQGDTGIADQSAGTIALAGNVQVNTITKKPQSTLFCDKMTFAESDRIVKASGNVHLDGNGSTLGNFDELWGSPDLKTVATPDLYPLTKAPAPPKSSTSVAGGHNLSHPATTKPNP